MNKTYWKTDWFIGLIVTLVFLLAGGTDLMRSVEWQAYDLAARFSSTDPANSDVVVVAIDDASLEELGDWPWSRDIMAQATRRLTAHRPSVIGFALPFDSTQTTYGLEYIHELQSLVEDNPRLANSRIRRLLNNAESRMDTDRVFANSLRQAGRVVLAMPYLIEKGRPQTGSAELSDYLAKFTLRDIQGLPDPDRLLSRLRPEPVPVADIVYPPIEQLARYAGGAGVLNLGYGGRRVRTEPLVIRYGESFLPSFALMMAARNQHLATRSIEVEISKGVSLGDYLIPSDRKLQIYPRFYRGKKDQSAFEVYSMLDVLDRKVENNTFRDKTVLVGLTARQHINPMITPIGEVMAPVMVTAHTVSSLLNEELFAVPGWTMWAQLLVFAAIGLYLMFLLPRFNLGTGLLMSALLAIVILNTHFYFMLSESTWLKLMGPLVALIVGHMVLSAKHFLEHQLQNIYTELSSANKQLGQSFHTQGQLDQAFEKYRKCTVDSSLLSQLYNLGLDYERKRQFNKAVAVFKYIADYNPNYNDVKERLKRTQEVSDAMVLGVTGTGNAAAANGTLVISSTGVQKPMLGRYQIDKELGRGAMGMVYLGHDPKIQRTVAIKTMSLAQEFEGEKLADVKARFFREAETAGRLNHPNIVTIYDVGEDQDLSYIAMDYLKGDNLLAWTKPENLLPPTEVLDLMIQVAEALDYANEKRVVHRDIKPANIIYDPESGVLKVTDFGVACLTDTSKTKTGTILGSPSYMSPEQLAGQKVDGRSDLFSLGITLYQMLSGELPFIADSLASLMYKIANEKHPDIRMFRPELPACVSQIINKALHKKAEDRFQTGAQMAKALTRCQSRLKGKKKKTTSRASA